MRGFLKAISLIIGLSAPVAAFAGPLDTLDQFCGGALSSPGCTETVATYPLEVGAVVAVIEAVKGQMSGADDCKNKLGAGSALANEVAPYLSEVGGDATKLIKCSCTIAYSTQTCSGEAEKIANDAADAVSWALHQLDSLLGLDDTPSGPTLQQNLDEYWATVFKPVEPLMIPVSDEDVLQTRHKLRDKCITEWWVTNEDEVAVCNGFMNRFIADVDQLRAQYQAYIKGQQEVAAAKLQAQKDAQQAVQDAATTNARKTAMNWAQIKLHTYSPQCHDDACLNALGFIAFAYYGKLATGMQNLNASNTQTLIDANKQFDPLFQAEIKKDGERLLGRKDLFFAALTPRLARMEQVNAVRAEARRRLMLLGVRNPDGLLRHAYRLRAHHVPIRGLTRQISVRSVAR